MTKRGGVVFGVVFAVATTAIACGAFSSGDDDTCVGASCGPASITDGGAAEAASEGSVGIPPGEEVPRDCVLKGPNDFEGCKCEPGTAPRTCAKGSLGDASRCTPGSQPCTGGLWAPCDETAVAPAPAELPFNEIDDDCDGRVEEGFICSSDVDVCKVDGGVEAPQVYVKVIPSTVKVNEPFDVVLVRHGEMAGSGRQSSIQFATTGNCPGGGSRKTCESAGRNCGGWSVQWHHFDKADIADPDGPVPPPLKLGANTVKGFFNESNANGPCGSSPEVTAEATLTVLPAD